MSASERRQAILEAMCYRRYDTRANLAFEFGVSKRTIENDVLILSTQYPIYTVRGKGGGIRIEEWYRLDRKYLTAEQLKLLERILKELSGRDYEVMRTIIICFGTKQSVRRLAC